MLYAKTESGDKILATHNAIGYCPCCSSLLTPRCGAIKIPHWSHHALDRFCAANKDVETQWHFDWKENFAKDMVEIRIANGQRLVDIYHNGIAIEFQKRVDVNDIVSRNNIYPETFWIFDKTLSDNAYRDEFVRLISDAIGLAIDSGRSDIIEISLPDGKCRTLEALAKNKTIKFGLDVGLIDGRHIVLMFRNMFPACKWGNTYRPRSFQFDLVTKDILIWQIKNIDKKTHAFPTVK